MGDGASLFRKSVSIMLFYPINFPSNFPMHQVPYTFNVYSMYVCVCILDTAYFTVCVCVCVSVFVGGGWYKRVLLD